MLAALILVAAVAKADPVDHLGGILSVVLVAAVVLDASVTPAHAAR